MLSTADSLDDFYERVLEVLEADEAYRLDTSRSISPESDVDRILDHADAERFHGGDLTLIKLFSVRATSGPLDEEGHGLLSSRWRPKEYLERQFSRQKVFSISTGSAGNLIEGVAVCSNDKTENRDTRRIDKVCDLSHTGGCCSLEGVDLIPAGQNNGVQSTENFADCIKTSYLISKGFKDFDQDSNHFTCSDLSTDDISLRVSSCEQLTTNNLNKFTKAEHNDRLSASNEGEFDDRISLIITDEYNEGFETKERASVSSLESLDNTAAFDKAVSYLANKCEHLKSNGFGERFLGSTNINLNASTSSNSLNIFEHDSEGSCLKTSNGFDHQSAGLNGSISPVFTDFSEAFDTAESFSFSTLNSMNSVLMTVNELIINHHPETDTDSYADATDSERSEDSLNLTIFDSQYSTDYDSGTGRPRLHCPPFSIHCTGSPPSYRSCIDAKFSFESIPVLQEPEKCFDLTLDNLSQYIDDSGSNYSINSEHQYVKSGTNMPGSKIQSLRPDITCLFRNSAVDLASRRSSCEAIIADDTSDYSFPEETEVLSSEPEVFLSEKSELENDDASSEELSPKPPGSSDWSFIDQSTDDCFENDSDNSAANYGSTARSRKRFFQQLLAQTGKCRVSHPHASYKQDMQISPIEDFDESDWEKETENWPAIQNYESRSFVRLMEMSQDGSLVQPISQSTRTEVQFAKTNRIPKIPEPNRNRFSY